MSEHQSLYDKIGGKDAVEAAVGIFYDKILADDRIKHFFDNIDMATQRRKQIMFMTYAFGGLPTYDGQNMRDAHKKLVEEQGLNDSHFDAVAECLQATLDELSVPAELSGEIMGIVGSTRDDVLNR